MFIDNKPSWQPARQQIYDPRPLYGPSTPIWPEPIACQFPSPYGPGGRRCPCGLRPQAQCPRCQQV